MDTEAKKNTDSVVYRSHDADKVVATEYARMSPENLRKEAKERGLSISRSKDRMVALLTANQAFTRGRNVGLSEGEGRAYEEMKHRDSQDERAKEDTKPENAHDDCDGCDEGEGHPCGNCGRNMSYIAGGGGLKMYACFSVDCMKSKDETRPCGPFCTVSGGGGAFNCSGGSGGSGPAFQYESSDSLYRKYVEALKREDALKGKVGMVMRCSLPGTVTPVELQRLSDRIEECVHDVMFPECSDHRTDAMRYGAPQPFTVSIKSESQGIPGIKSLLLGITFLIIGGLPCDALRMDMCVDGSNMMGYIGLAFVGLAAFFHVRSKR